MVTAASSAEEVAPGRRQLLTGVAGIAVLIAVFAAGLSWAKWVPYAHKASRLSVTHTWAGGTLFTASGAPGTVPTFSGAWHFTSTYFSEVWEGFLAALVIAAVFDSLVPRACAHRCRWTRQACGSSRCASPVPCSA